MNQSMISRRQMSLKDTPPTCSDQRFAPASKPEAKPGAELVGNVDVPPRFLYTVLTWDFPQKDGHDMT